MCAIIGSFNPEKLAELIQLNSHRGNHSYSLLRYNWKEKKIQSLMRSFGSFHYRELLNESIDGQTYYIAHTQAPTTYGTGFFNIHPSGIDDTLLYHNGILKEDYITDLQRKHDTLVKWDTNLLHKFYNSGYDLSDVNGTFSCLYYNTDWTLFRNEISPMFIDDDFSISSTKFPGSKPTPANMELVMDFERKNLEMFNTFETKENPYFFG